MRRKLLLADDSITIQKVIGITFVKEDFDLSVVDNGEAALEKALTERPDLILADVFMPGKNGYELCAAIKAEPSLSRIPVLLLTGTFEPFDEAKAKSVGADGWISKPFESQALIRRVKELLEKAEAEASVSAEPEDLLPPAAAEADIWEEFDAVPSASTSDLDTVSAAAQVEPDEADFGNIFGPEDNATVSEAGNGQTADDIWEDVPLIDEEPAPEPATKTELEDLWSPPAPAVPVPVADSAPVTAAPSGSTEPEELPQVETLTAVEDTGDDLFIFEEDDLTKVAESADPLDEDLLAFESEAEPVPVSGESEIEEDILELDEEDILDLDEEDILDLDEGEISGADSATAQVAGFEDDFFFVDEEMEPVEEMSLAQETFFEEATPEPVIPEPEPVIPEPEPVIPEPEPVIPEPEPVIPEPAPVAPVAAQAAAVESRVQTLSDEDLEAIVEKVAGAVIERLAGTLLEKIAWEIVPDLAESLIKEEIRQIKESVI